MKNKIRLTGDLKYIGIKLSGLIQKIVVMEKIQFVFPLGNFI